VTFCEKNLLILKGSSHKINYSRGMVEEALVRI
jgi:hypothetical protein